MLILLILSFLVFMCGASRICSRSLLLSCGIIMVFSTRIFSKSEIGNSVFLRCKSMELESLRCIVKHLERVLEVRPTYILFLLETQSL